ncbi:hypothetical protein CHELA40_11577 [Chelatococcus asaccharovorans]|nr:hypothetical protein CHELA40_11577 [Chelatococcus asaccharovorans]CAH1684489.1 hypothetical protein CHELA17_64025 [Chelatococcus asaccharovorans]
MARNRLRRWRASPGAGRGAPRHRLHRLRALHQWHGEAARRRRGARARQHTPVRRGRSPPAAASAGGERWPRLSALSRSVAETPASQAALRIRRDFGGVGARAEAGCGLLLRDGHRRLCRLDAGPDSPFGRFHLDGRGARRLAQALGGLAGHPLRGQGPARGARAGLFYLPEALRANSEGCEAVSFDFVRLSDAGNPCGVPFLSYIAVPSGKMLHLLAARQGALRRALFVFKDLPSCCGIRRRRDRTDASDVPDHRFDVPARPVIALSHWPDESFRPDFRMVRDEFAWPAKPCEPEVEERNATCTPVHWQWRTNVRFRQSRPFP